MLKKFIECGQIVGTHGVRGEVRVNPWCDSPKFLTKFNRFYLSPDGAKFINAKSVRPNNNIVLIKFEGIDTIENAMQLKGTTIYIKREDADIGNRHFIDELIGCEVFDSETSNKLGVVSDVTQLPSNDVWHIEKDGKEYLIPAIDSVINQIDIENNKVVITALKGIFDDED